MGRFKDKAIRKMNRQQVAIDVKKLFQQMSDERDAGKTPEIFKTLDTWQRENNLDCKNIEHCKLFAKKYLELKKIHFEESPI